MTDRPCTRCHGTGRVEDRRLGTTPEQKTTIRERLAQGERASALAHEYGVHKTTISRIRHDVGPRL